MKWAYEFAPLMFPTSPGAPKCMVLMYGREWMIMVYGERILYIVLTSSGHALINLQCAEDE